MPSNPRKRGSPRTRKNTDAGTSTAQPETGDLATLRKVTQELQVHQVELEMQNQALRESQQELEASRDRYAELYDFTPVGHATLSVEGAILETNLTLATMLGTNRLELERRPFSLFVNDESKQAYRQLLAQARRTREKLTLDISLRPSASSTIFAHLIVLFTRSSGGDDRFLVGIIDNTRDILAERKLRESQEQLNDALEVTRMVAWSHDFATDTVTQSENTPALLGTLPDQPYRVHKEMTADIDQADVPQYEQALEEAIRTGSSYVVQFRLRSRATGVDRWFEEHGRVILDPKGNASHVRGVLFDITDRKKLEQTLQTNYELLTGFVTNTTEPVALLDGSGTVTCISRAGAGLLGYAAEELVGKDAVALAYPQDVQHLRGRFASLDAASRPANAMLRVRQQNGAWAWFDLDASVVERPGNGNGYVVRISTVNLPQER